LGAAAQLVNVRAGRDGEDGTADDVLFSSLSEVGSLLGISDGETSVIRQRLGFSDLVQRVECEVQVGSIRRLREVVVQREAPTQLFSWREYPLP
ncbi:MAG: hypothetical protein AAF191_20480, partial [Verrucomicrobiota bacterium]